jgi:hypothetical protein
LHSIELSDFVFHVVSSRQNKMRLQVALAAASDYRITTKELT